MTWHLLDIVRQCTSELQVTLYIVKHDSQCRFDRARYIATKVLFSASSLALFLSYLEQFTNYHSNNIHDQHFSTTPQDSPFLRQHRHRLTVTIRAYDSNFCFDIWRVTNADYLLIFTFYFLRQSSIPPVGYRTLDVSTTAAAPTTLLLFIPGSQGWLW